MPTLRLMAATAALAMASAAPLAAQRSTEANDAKLRANCRLAAQVLETGHPSTHYEWAVNEIRRCEQIAGPALAAHWSALREADRADLKQLMFSSSSMRDQRIFDAVLSVAGSRDVAPIIRLAALSVLVSYADPVLDVSLERLEKPKENELLGHVTHFAPSEGAVPLAAGDLPALMSLLRTLAEQEPDPQVAAAARYLLRGFEARGVAVSPS